MMKRILSMLMTLVMLLSLAPWAVLSAEAATERESEKEVSISYTGEDMFEMRSAQEKSYDLAKDLLLDNAAYVLNIMGEDVSSYQESLELLKVFYNHTYEASEAIFEGIETLQYFYHKLMLKQYADDYRHLAMRLEDLVDEWNNSHNIYCSNLVKVYKDLYNRSLELIGSAEGELTEAEYSRYMEQAQKRHMDAWNRFVELEYGFCDRISSRNRVFYEFFCDIAPLTVNGHEVDPELETLWRDYTNGKVDIEAIWECERYAVEETEDRNSDRRMMKPYNAAGSEWVLGSGYSKWDIVSVNFLNDISRAPEDSWDVSEKQNGNVLAWVRKNPGTAGGYDLYIGAKGGVVAPENCRGMFCFYDNLQQIWFDGNFDTSGVRTMAGMFSWCKKLLKLDLSSLDTGAVTDMSDMFAQCYKLYEIDLTGVDTSSVISMKSMFQDCQELRKFDLSGFDTARVRTMSLMFQLVFVYSLDLSSFDTSSVVDMNSMMSNNPYLNEVNVSSFDTSSVIDIAGMFRYGKMLGYQTAVDFSSFTFENAKSVGGMFKDCQYVRFEDVQHFVFDPEVTKDYENFMPGTAWETLFQ